MHQERFLQAGPSIQNQYQADRTLRSILKRRIPPEHLAAIEADLERFGERVASDVLRMSVAAEADGAEPRLVQFSPWGERIDEIQVSQAWKDLDRVAAEEGIVAIGYERRFGEYSRLYQMAKLYLFHPSSALYSCPLAMTDGAARAIEVYGDEALKSGAFRHLTSRDPGVFWTSGQWMTERAGGSDVGETGTVARPENGGYRLFGEKWFTSATTSQMAMTLARIEGAQAGSRGLSLFYLEPREAQGRLNRIRVLRLKDKLGTRALPTAELELDGTPARLVGGEGQGIRKIASLFNVTRVYNAVCATAGMRRGIVLARDYARKRRAFGKLLAEHPLHVETLAALEVEQEACLHLILHLAELMGREETGKGTAEQSAILRALTPIAKLYTGKQGVLITSEVLECFGGAGYIEDTGIPKLLRDNQVLAIWEGTTNVLCLDLLRAIEKENALPPLLADTHERLKKISRPELMGAAGRILQVMGRVQGFLPDALAAPSGPLLVQAAARTFAFALARVFVAGLMLEHAEAALVGGQDRRAVSAALRFCSGSWTSELDRDWELRPGRLDESAELGIGPGPGSGLQLQQ